MNYFDHPYCSNSDLTQLKLELHPAEAPAFADALRFGTLVHALILEPGTVDHIRLMVNEYQYTRAEFDLGRRMRDAFLANAFCKTMLLNCDKEVEMYHPETEFAHEGIEFTLNTRRKYDLFSFAAGWGGDIKSTTATSHDQFLAAINRFDYDRGRVFYAKGSGSKKDVIIGISKINMKVFIVPVADGSDLWKSGEKKCNELAFKYWALKDDILCN